MNFHLRIVAILTLFAVSCRGAAGQESTDQTAIRDALLQLASDDQERRMSAVSDLADSRDGRLVMLLERYNEGRIYLWNDQQVVVCLKIQLGENGAEVGQLQDALTGEILQEDGQDLVVPAGELKAIELTRRERRAVAVAIRLLEIWSPDTDKRVAAIQRFGSSRHPQFLRPLGELMETDLPNRVELRVRESLLLIRVAGKIPDQNDDDRLSAIQELGESCAARAVPALNDVLRNEGDVTFHQAAREALRKVESYQQKARIAQNAFNGLSLGSVLILMALGLSIIFGQMGVINMAHGELMMIGAFATYEMQLLFGHTPDSPSNWYFVAAIPVAFASAALVGYFIERLVVRHLYDRPLETLLATWGVGLILVQTARVKYGDNIGVNSPTWLVGAVEPIQDVVVPYNRAFILGLCLFCIACIYCVFRFTRLGLLIRATVQGRDTAGTLGVNTRRVDGYTFAIGSGLAGIAGCAWTLVGGVTPDMGQNHIVDSFLVVVSGGVGNLLGTVLAGLGIGSLSKVFEPMTFGESMTTSGTLMTVICWAGITRNAFHQNARWGWFCLLIPFPAPAVFAWRTRASDGRTLQFAFYLAGLAVVWLTYAFNGSAFLNEPVRAIWAKVLILLMVVVFIQWRPQGMFPPKGRLADA